MLKFRSRPIVIEAFQMTKERRLDNSEWPEWLNAAWQKSLTELGAVFCSSDGCLAGEKCTPLFIQTLKGTQRIEWNDWIVQSVLGELSLCKPNTFEAAYEPV